MDQFYQVIYGPNEDKLKHCGAAWLALSLLANVAGSNVTGFIGLLAILAVVTKSEYLLFLVSLTSTRGDWDSKSSAYHLKCSTLLLKAVAMCSTEGSNAGTGAVQFLVLAPLSLLITLIYIWREPKTFGLVILQLLHAGIQVCC